MLILLLLLVIGLASNLENLLEELVSDVLMEDSEEKTAGWFAEHYKGELKVKNGFSAPIVMYAKVACEYRLLTHSKDTWNTQLKIMNFVNVQVKGSKTIDETFSFNDGTALNGQTNEKQSFSCPGTGYVLKDYIRRNLDEAKGDSTGMSMKDFTKYIKDSGSNEFIKAMVETHETKKYQSILIKDGYQPAYPGETITFSRDCSKNGGGGEIFLSIMYYHKGAICQYRLNHKIENGILFEMVGTAENPKQEINRTVCHGYDKDCGCFRGYCRSTCSFGKNWCYTSDGNSQSSTYQKCNTDLDCEWGDNCGGPCTVFDSYLYGAKGTQEY